MSDNTALIIGTAGFLGRYAARYFHELGWRTIGVDRTPPENSPLADLAEYYSLDLPDPHLGTILSQYRPTACLFCAGRAAVGRSLLEPAEDFHAGPLLMFETLELLRRHAGDCRLIFLSSAAVYGNPVSLPISENQLPAPISPYGYHKWQSELLCQEYHRIFGLPTASLRIFSAYGPGLRRQVIWDICQKVLTQNCLRLQGTGQESRDFVHALDVARAMYTLFCAAPLAGEVYNLASSQPLTIVALAGQVAHLLGREIEIEFDGQTPPGNPLYWQADISRIRALGYSPTVPFDQGLATTIAWAKAELGGF